MLRPESVHAIGAMPESPAGKYDPTLVTAGPPTRGSAVAGVHMAFDEHLTGSSFDAQVGESVPPEFQDVAKTVQSLAAKMQAAEKAGDAKATEWLRDLTEGAAAPQPEPQHRGLLGGMLGGMMGGGMLGGYYGGGFGRAMEMGMAMNLGANLVSSILR
jgi:hypothetical protein